MERPKVIASKYLPTRTVGLFQWAVIITVLHYWGAPGWAWGIVCTLCGLLTLVSRVLSWFEVSVSPSEITKR